MPYFRQGSRPTFGGHEASPPTANVGAVNRLRRQSKRQVVYDVLLWAGLSVLAATAGPDPLADPGGFLLVTGARALLIAVAVLVGRAWPLAALLITTFVTPWSMTASFATSSLVWPPGIGTVKILPAASLAPGIVWYAYLAGRRAVRWWPGRRRSPR